MKSRVSAEVAEMFSKHELTQVGTDPETYYLHEPGAMKNGRLVQRAQSTLIVFTKEGIVVMGDLCPGRNGVISNLGYGVDWFSKKLSEDYLCEKFLDQSLNKEGFRSWLQGRLEDERNARAEVDEGDRQELAQHERNIEGLKQALRDVDDDSILESVRESILLDLGEYQGDGQGYDYEPREAGHLCAIQQRFAALYAKQEPKQRCLSERTVRLKEPLIFQCADAQGHTGFHTYPTAPARTWQGPPVEQFFWDDSQADTTKPEAEPRKCPALSTANAQTAPLGCISEAGHDGLHMTEDGVRWLEFQGPQGTSERPCDVNPTRRCPTQEQLRETAVVGGYSGSCAACPALQTWLREG